MIINICNMKLEETSCDYIVRNIGCRCCNRGCNKKDCAYRCHNDPEKCNILMEYNTDMLSKKYRVNWNDFK